MHKFDSDEAVEKLLIGEAALAELEYYERRAKRSFDVFACKTLAERRDKIELAHHQAWVDMKAFEQKAARWAWHGNDDPEKRLYDSLRVWALQENDRLRRDLSLIDERF